VQKKIRQLNAVIMSVIILYSAAPGPAKQLFRDPHVVPECPRAPPSYLSPAYLQVVWDRGLQQPFTLPAGPSKQHHLSTSTSSLDNLTYPPSRSLLPGPSKSHAPAPRIARLRGLLSSLPAPPVRQYELINC
jgi:hypothetical protein